MTPFTILLIVSGFGQTTPVPDARCGAYCLYTSLRALGAPVGSFDEIEQRLGPAPSSGYNLANLASLAEAYGMRTLGVVTTAERLQQRKRPFACIVLLDKLHFVNVADVCDGQAYIVDAPQDYTIPIDTLRARWDGTALLLAPSDLVDEESLGNHSAFMGWLLGLGAIAAMTGFALFARRALLRHRAVAAVVLSVTVSGCWLRAPAIVPARATVVHVAARICTWRDSSGSRAPRLHSTT